MAYAAAATDPTVTDNGGGCTGEVIDVPEIVRNPYAPTWVEPGDDVVLEVQAATVTKSDTLHYNWYKDGEPVLGAPDSPMLTLPSVSHYDEGVYTCAVHNEWGTAKSNPARVEVASGGFPAAGCAGLALLAAAIGLTTAMRLRRRPQRT